MWCNWSCNCFEMEGGKKSKLNCSVLASRCFTKIAVSTVVFHLLTCMYRSRVLPKKLFVFSCILCNNVIYDKSGLEENGTPLNGELLNTQTSLLEALSRHKATRWKACCNYNRWDVMYRKWWIAHCLTIFFWKHSWFCTQLSRRKLLSKK